MPLGVQECEPNVFRESARIESAASVDLRHLRAFAGLTQIDPSGGTTTIPNSSERVLIERFCEWAITIVG